MRQVLAYSAIFAVIASPALAVQDRYGPPRAQGPSAPREIQIPTAALLNWNGKPAVTMAEPAAAAEQTRPAPLAPWAQRAAPATAQPLMPAPVAAQPAPQPQAFVARPSLPARVQASTPVQAQPAAVQPQVRAQAQAQAQAPAPLPVQAQAPASMTRNAMLTPQPTARDGYESAPRFYSVSRQYGAKPDPIATPSSGRGEALTLAESPMTPGLGRSNAPLDDGRQAQAVITADTKQNAAANRVSRLGF